MILEKIHCILFAVNL